MWSRRKFLTHSAATLSFLSGSQRIFSQIQDQDSTLASFAANKLNPLAQAPNWNQLASYSGTIQRNSFDHAITRVYGSNSTFPMPWKVDGEKLRVQTGSASGTIDIPFATLNETPKKPNRFWRSAKDLPALNPGEPPLKGLHIAIDPGHIGGNYAQMEERWLTMDNGATVIMEGSLVLQVAYLLKPRLEALGAQVSLVRNQDAPVTTAKIEDFRDLAIQILHDAGITDPPETYHNRQDDNRIISIQWQCEKLFYRVSEIRARAQRVNQDLRPDLVLCLHLNAEAWGDPKNPQFVNKNHFHLLINGCYSADELQYEDTRFEMLSRLFQGTHTEELALADIVANEMAESTQLEPYVYPGTNARRVSDNPYIFARNLLASRLYQSPVLYFEPYVMNHEMTYRRLSLGHYIGRTLVQNQLVTSPLEDYTRGIVRGLTKYYQKARNQA